MIPPYAPSTGVPLSALGTCVFFSTLSASSSVVLAYIDPPTTHPTPAPTTSAAVPSPSDILLAVVGAFAASSRASPNQRRFVPPRQGFAVAFGELPRPIARSRPLGPLATPRAHRASRSATRRIAAGLASRRARAFL